eukprot:EG_transcript_45310
MKYEKIAHIDGKVVKYGQVKRYFVEPPGNCLPELTALVLCLHKSKGSATERCRPMWQSAIKCSQRVRKQTYRDDPLIQSFYEYVGKLAKDPWLMKPNFK